jgi:hypothetical protein
VRLSPPAAPLGCCRARWRLQVDQELLQAVELITQLTGHQLNLGAVQLLPCLTRLRAQSATGVRSAFSRGCREAAECQHTMPPLTAPLTSACQLPPRPHLNVVEA